MRALLKRIFDNFQYKFAAFLLAAFFWYIVQGQEVLEINRKIQVHIKTPEGYLLKGNNVRIKDATLSGSRVLLGDFSSRPLEAYINIPEGKTGRVRFRVDKEYIPNWNPQIKLTVHDAYINVFVEAKQTRTLAIKEHLQGLPAEGFIIEKTSVEPSKVTVTGLKSELSKLNYVTTEAIDVSGLQKSKIFEVPLETKDLHTSQLSVEQVSVHVQVGAKKVNRRFANIPIELEDQNFNNVIRPSLVSIVVQGNPTVLDGIKRGDLRAFLDVHDLSPGRYEKKVLVKIPSDTVLIETLPESVMIEVIPR